MSTILRDALAELEQAEAHYRLTFEIAPSADHLDVGRAWDRMRKAGDKARAAIAQRDAQPVIPDCVVADVGFRWNSEAQHHVPHVLVEFTPCPANSPADANGWTDRDAFAALLAASPQEAQPARELLSDAEIRDLVKECGLDWHRGFMRLFEGDDTNRYAVLVREVERIVRGEGAV